ncbi:MULTISPECIES: dipeptide/oligopeptide/nickel ABC transporter permease/ATP-binding protein [unclassified Rhodococcus (in: high G+C Gram-positive bacteria)]|uniref:dipeptide/oligopeptide/nickel ABC transporter permease/ATP-binding protein n=1 Tax=unclassified Rhodococcus (in: high G+C Gram-positive bacteria) TaxID=192944 RepID=UPI0024B6D249|nr:MULTISPECIES: dipeptide/oligopeptide/nickel ABC transporter permease/ATP-binding protein [unclassified Rhodococcus (in: high G+C Gram-positive bacteria)]MDI9957072.1 dipeptide/oligopeptide/nickel ABC transporter permease/ATP-binding protein [Rhodococcus sp. IEGM 1237]MDI9962387.1 dipeptide/oligopeptide/nickel ABC transporter permease/ATP-binding protein [Rhodococcus sp. IEGM 1251]MDV8125575.1 dipeptide/oligopeptide/nickel ABC transporter permease/ATP-binding protein [Rhodococcus sp. IEGM 1304
MRRKLTEKLSRPGITFSRFPLSAWLSMAVLAIIVLACLVAPLITQYTPLEQAVGTAGPSAEHWFGQDSLGRDLFSRLLYGGRWSLTIGLGSTFLALCAGALIGSVAATSRKGVDETIMRVLDVVMAFPGIALAAVLVAAFGGSIPVLIVTIAFLYTPMVARVVRANVLAQYGEDYVAAEKVIGARTSHIVVKHVVANCAAPVLVFCTVMVADAIVLEASLSFIGAGVRPPDPSWGSVIADGKNMVLLGGWWATVFPGLLILLTVLSLNVLAEGLTDAMADPSLKKTKKTPSALEAAQTAAAEETSNELILEDEAAVTEAPELIDDFADSSVVKDVLKPAAEPTPLETHLKILAETERSRSDRLVYEGDAAPLLEVRNLTIRFPERYGDTAIVDNVSFTVRPNETMALVGESGCGKSLTSLAIMGLLPKTAVVTGEILFDGVNVLELNNRERNKLRGHDMAMIYQDALSSLNPAMLIRAQFKQLTKRGGTRTAEELLELVGLDPVRTLASYPHELSGGQRQRVLIAMSLTRSPRLIVADEPTTALDVTVQAQVVELLNDLREKLGFAMVFVSHDLALVASLAHKITVMYAGQVVESAPTSDLLVDPRHEYTQGLLGAVLSIEDEAPRLHQIQGTVPSPGSFAPGDRFAERSTRPDSDPLRKPEMVRIDGTEHFFANQSATPAHAESELESVR